MTDETPELEQWALLARYVAGECSPAERTRVERWLAAEPSRRTALEEMRIGAVDAAAATRPGDPAARKAAQDAAWRSLSTAMGVGRPARRIERIVVGLIGIAAVLVVGAVVAHGVARGPAGAEREYVTAPGARETVTLSDGTQLTLAPASRVRVPATYGRNGRDLTLDGGARFTVVHDARHPFAIHTSRATIRDVGTTFSVHAYREDATDVIAVAEGEVAVSGVSLRARDIASIDGAGRVVVRRNVDVAPYLEWAQGALVFNATPLREAVRDVARAYDLEIQIADSTLGNELVTGSFGGRSADEVLDAMSQIVGAHVERTGRVIVIRRGVTPARRPESGAAADLRVTQTGGQS